MPTIKMEKALERELHDLCQPLTTLQCRLEYGLMLDDEVSLRAAVEGGLQECARLFESIAAMREHLTERRRARGSEPQRMAQ